MAPLFVFSLPAFAHQPGNVVARGTPPCAGRLLLSLLPLSMFNNLTPALERVRWFNVWFRGAIGNAYGRGSSRDIRALSSRLTTAASGRRIATSSVTLAGCWCCCCCSHTCFSQRIRCCRCCSRPSSVSLWETPLLSFPRLPSVCWRAGFSLYRGLCMPFR